MLRRVAIHIFAFMMLATQVNAAGTSDSILIKPIPFADAIAKGLVEPSVVDQIKDLAEELDSLGSKDFLEFRYSSIVNASEGDHSVYPLRNEQSNSVVYYCPLTKVVWFTGKISEWHKDYKSERAKQGTSEIAYHSRSFALTNINDLMVVVEENISDEENEIPEEHL